MVLNKLRELFKPKEEENPWEAPEPKEITEEDIERALEEWRKPKKPKTLIAIAQSFVLLWIIAHFALLYAMAGSPISGGIFLYVVVDIIMSGACFMLLNKERKQ